MIEFRVWDKINKCWINTFKVVLAVGGEVQSIQDIYGEIYGLHQVILEQYINKKDKDNKKIHEGDRVECRCTADDLLEDGYKKGNLFLTGIVVYNPDICAYVLRKGIDIQITSKMDLTIIGTIHDKKTR